MNQPINYVFDANQHEPDAGLDAIPAGTYNVAIESTEVASMKDDKGEAFKVGFVVTDGEYKGRKLFNNYNLWHKLSQQTVEIAHKQLSALCHVTRVMTLDFNNEGAALKGAQLKIRVDNDGKYNSVKEVFDINGNKPARAGAGMAPAAVAPAAVATPAQPAQPAQPMQPAQPAAAAPVAQPAPVVAQPAQPANPAAFAGQQAAPAAAQPAAAPAWNQAQPAAQPAAPAGGAAPAAAAPAAPWGQPAA